MWTCRLSVSINRSFYGRKEIWRMKLEIELDLNKIDYDAINKQIAEKVAELNI